MNPFVITRILVGGLFLFSGASKLIEPYQNFLYVVQSYEVFPPFLAEISAHVVPWVEMFLGLFLVLGLYLPWVLRALLLFIASFIAIVGQAIIRNLPIKECGCFGEFLSLPLQAVIGFDTTMFLTVIYLLFKESKTAQLSLDQYFA